MNISVYFCPKRLNMLQMKIRYLIFSSLLCLSFQLFASNLTIVRQVTLVHKQSVLNPFLLDSTDVNGSKFKVQQLVDAFVPQPITDYSKFATVIADTAGVFQLTKPEKGTELCYFEFQVYANRFSKSKLNIASNCDFTIYVNGSKKDGAVGSKLNLSKATEKSVELSMIPQSYSIGVSCLLNAMDKTLPTLKIGFSDDSTNIVQTALNVATKRKLSYEDIVNNSSPYDVSISYKGTYLMNKISSTLQGGEKSSFLELINRASGKRVMQTNARMDVAWMPKTENLYFIEKQAGIRVLKTINPLTQEITEFAKNIPEGYVSWSPDEKYLIISRVDKYNDKESDVKYYILPSDRFAGWRNGSSLCKFDLATGAVQQLTFGSKDVSLQDISEDGQKIIFSTSEVKITQRPFSSSCFYQYDLATNKVDSLWMNVSFIGSVKYSPDGKQLLILGAPAAFNKLGEDIGKLAYSNDYDTQAYLYDFSNKKLVHLTRNFAPTIQQAIWNVADGAIYFKVSDRDYERIYRYSPTKKNFEMLPLQVDLLQQIHIAGAGLYAVYRGMSANYPSKAFSLNLETMQSAVISDPEKEKMSKIALGEMQDFNFKNQSGTTIYGRYYLPCDFDKTKKYPLIVYYYGGTTPTQRSFSSNWNFNYWTTLGYVVYVVQPSGTIGFGQKFSALHVNAWGEKTADDIIQGVKSFCNAHPFVNSKKIGCLGASYGGFMTMYLQTKTNIFATAISHAGISALSSYWGNGYWGYQYSGTATANTYPWNNPKFYTEHSPLFLADKINTPLLLIQGELDTNVPPGESMQMFTALKILGKPVSMIRVKNEDHIITDYQHKKDWNYSIMAWMAKYLQNDPGWWESLYPESKR